MPIAWSNSLYGMRGKQAPPGGLYPAERWPPRAAIARRILFFAVSKERPPRSQGQRGFRGVGDL